jgi:hypothetical protein
MSGQVGAISLHPSSHWANSKTRRICARGNPPARGPYPHSSVDHELRHIGGHPVTSPPHTSDIGTRHQLTSPDPFVSTGSGPGSIWTRSRLPAERSRRDRCPGLRAGPCPAAGSTGRGRRRRCRCRRSTASSRSHPPAIEYRLAPEISIRRGSSPDLCLPHRVVQVRLQRQYHGELPRRWAVIERRCRTHLLRRSTTRRDFAEAWGEVGTVEAGTAPARRRGMGSGDQVHVV